MIDYDKPDEDPIVAEVRAAREAIAARFNYDLNALFDYADKRTKELRQSGHIILDPPQQPSSVKSTPSKKVG